MSTIKSLFDSYSEIKLDKTLLSEALNYGLLFINKNERHISFFGGNLIGVYPIYFVKDDEYNWFNDVLKIYEPKELQRELFTILDPVKNRNISRDAINLSFFWLAHKALNATTLNDKQKIQLATVAIKVFLYKAITSLHGQRWKHASENYLDVAMAVYEGLTLKSQIKQYETWETVLSNMALNVVTDHEIMFNSILRFDNDLEITDTLTYLWDKLKSVLQVLANTYYDIEAKRNMITSTSKFQYLEGEKILKEASSKFYTIKENMHIIVPDENSFIMEDLLEAITHILNSSNIVKLRTLLKFLSVNYKTAKYGNDIVKTIDDIIYYVFDLISKKKIDINHIPVIALTLRTAFRVSRVNSTILDDIKESLTGFITICVPRIDANTLASLRIGVMLYISIRALIRPKS